MKIDLEYFRFIAVSAYMLCNPDKIRQGIRLRHVFNNPEMANARGFGERGN